MKTKFILSKKEYQFFLTETQKMIHKEPFLRLKNYPHHGTIPIYSHVIKVAYLSYCYALKHHLKVQYKELIEAALLHDLYFYDWHGKKGIHLHGLFHPAKAVRNAKQYYHPTKRVIRHMAHHMFPLTLIPPTTKEGWIICWCDKKASISDYRAVKKKKKALRKLQVKI